MNAWSENHICKGAGLTEKKWEGVQNDEPWLRCKLIIKQVKRTVALLLYSEGIKVHVGCGNMVKLDQSRCQNNA